MTIRIGAVVSFNDVQNTVVRSMQLLNNGVETYHGQGFELHDIYVYQTTETVMRLLREAGIAPVWPAAEDRRWPGENDQDVLDYLWLVILLLKDEVARNS